MSDPPKAVFLSYASQDSNAARQICEALRASGVEVWFDAAGGLEHGDEWDTKIRRQIKECTFFLPVISANTQSRLEGYFRIEWELAAERAMGFAPNVPFILPIVIDQTGESDALVPERFRRVQWTRLPGGVVPAEVQARFLKLWAERAEGVVARPLQSAGGDDTVRKIRATPAGSPAPTHDDKSIAVLPFANMSADADNEYFSDGMTEEIINALVQVPELRVAARTSVFAFKGKADDLRTIAAKLNVRTVLEGSVRKAGNKVRITAQLINAADGYHLWSERYDRSLDDIFAVQDEIARTIAEKMKAKLGDGERKPLVVAPTDDVEAYQLYLQGRFFWNQRGAGLLKGLKFFEAALARDPEYALALTGVADTYTLLAFYGIARPTDVMPKARAAAERALAIAPTLAEAHNALAFILLNYHWDVAGARTEFCRAIELKPTSVTARYWFASVAIAQGRFHEAVTIDEEAVRIEPLSLFANTHLGWMLLCAGRAEDAARRLAYVLEIEPRFLLAHWLLGLAYIALGRNTEGLTELKTSVELANKLPWMVASLGAALALVGRKDEARGVLTELTRRAGTEYVKPFHFAVLHACLGEEEAALTWLEQAVVERDFSLAYLAAETEHFVGNNIPGRFLDPARRAALVKRLGLTPP
jgi:TolB-like protein/Flp pilus assembly protein TadD